MQGKNIISPFLSSQPMMSLGVVHDCEHHRSYPEVGRWLKTYPQKFQRLSVISA